MLKKSAVVIVALACFVSSNGKVTIKPINKDMVKDIKKKTAEWQPYEADENPLAGYSREELFSLAGTQLPNISEESQKQMDKLTSEL